MIYKVDDSEVHEDSGLILDGENWPNSDGQCYDSDSDDLPVRELTNFTFYEPETLELCAITHMDNLSCSGEARAHVERDSEDEFLDDIDDIDDENEDNHVKVKLTRILDTWLDPTYNDQ